MKKFVVGFIIIVLVVISIVLIQGRNKKIQDTGDTNSSLPPVEVINLWGTKWKAVKINNQDISESITLQIDQNAVGFSICNQINYGAIDITADTINFHSGYVSTRETCDEALTNRETELLNILNKPTKYSIQNEVLTLTADKNKIIFNKINEPDTENLQSGNSETANPNN